MLVHNFRGFGPGLTELVPEMMSWQAHDANEAHFQQAPRKKPSSKPTGALLPSGAFDTRLPDMARLVSRMMKPLEEQAEGQLVGAVEHDPALSVEQRVNQLGKILEDAKTAQRWTTVLQALKVGPPTRSQVVGLRSDVCGLRA
jgi:hypothetical protein